MDADQVKLRQLMTRRHVISVIKGATSGANTLDHRLGVGSRAGAVAKAPFPAPARRTVHAVLPHTALRRSSPPAFGRCPPGPERPGGDDGSAQGDQPEVVR